MLYTRDGERYVVHCSVAQGEERDRLFERKAAQIAVFTKSASDDSRVGLS